MTENDDQFPGDSEKGVSLTRRQLWCIWVLCLVAGLVVGYRIWDGRGRHDIDLRDGGARVRYRIDINKAGWDELVALKNIGEVRAKAIVAWRKDHGPFRSLDDLKKVRHNNSLVLSEKLIEGIRDDITF